VQRPDAAEADLAEVVVPARRLAWRVLHLRVLNAQRRFDVARERSTSWVRDHPKHAELWRERWRACAGAGDRDGVLTACRAAVELNPLPDRVVECSGAFVARGRLKPARAMLTAALERSTDVLLRSKLVDLELAAGDVDAALRTTRGGRGVTWAVRRAEILAGAGRPGAAAALAEVLEDVRRRQRRRKADLLGVLEARIRLAQGDRAEAVRLLRGIVARNPKYDEARLRLQALLPAGAH